MPGFLGVRWNNKDRSRSHSDSNGNNHRRGVIGNLISRATPPQQPSSSSFASTPERRRGRGQQNSYGRRLGGRKQRRTSKSSQGSLSIPSTAYSSDEFSLPPSVASYPRAFRRSFHRTNSAHTQLLRRQQASASGEHDEEETSESLQPFMTRICSSVPILMDDSHRYALHSRVSGDNDINDNPTSCGQSLELTSRTNPSIMATMTRLPNIDDVFTIQDTMENEDASSSASVIVFRQAHNPIHALTSPGSPSIPSYRYKVYAKRSLWQGQSTSARYPNFYFWGHIIVTTENGNNATIAEEDQQSIKSSGSSSAGSGSAIPIGASCTKVSWMLHECGAAEARVRDVNQVSTQYTAKQHYQQIHTIDTHNNSKNRSNAAPILRRRKTKWTTIQKEQRITETKTKSVITCARIVHCPNEPSVLGATMQNEQSYRELVVRPGQDAGLVLCFVGILDDLERLQV